VDPLLAYIEASRKDLIALIRELVECESPSGDEAALTRFNELVGDRLTALAAIRTLPGGHLRCEFELPGKRKKGQILVLGHSDTVWPLGTLTRMPFREAEGRLWGPGVLDMKGGLAFFIHAMRGLKELEVPVSTRVVLLLNCDEEVGSDSSRRFTESEARSSRAVLVLEPATGLEGKLKTARKGVGDFTVKARGKAAHAGLDFEHGANAIVELARQIERIAGFTNLERGITVSPGIIAGGSRSNVVPDEARAVIDLRVRRLRDAPALERKFRSLRPFDKRCRIEVEGGLNRPPMERLPGTVQLFQLARKLASELGVELEESLSGGGSDGNFTAALGVPTLDGLGAVGEGAHAPHESILVDRMADRTALVGKLVAAL
jgi:glutamate carboxypeptidase